MGGGFLSRRRMRSGGAHLRFGLKVERFRLVARGIRFSLCGRKAEVGLTTATQFQLYLGQQFGIEQRTMLWAG